MQRSNHGKSYGQIQGNIEEMGTTVSDVTRENDDDREFGGFDALACGKLRYTR
jgi:hypothetical protein